MPTPKRPIWTLLAFLFPAIGVALIWWVDAQPARGSNGNGYAVAAAIFFFGGGGCALGMLSGLIAFWRRERWRWLAWLALAVNLAPLGWLVTEL